MCVSFSFSVRDEGTERLMSWRVSKNVCVSNGDDVDESESEDFIENQSLESNKLSPYLGGWIVCGYWQLGIMDFRTAQAP